MAANVASVPVLCTGQLMFACREGEGTPLAEQSPEPGLAERQTLEHVGVRLAHRLDVADPQVGHAAHALVRLPQQARLARACTGLACATISTAGL